jgi:hypothetical protein
MRYTCYNFMRYSMPEATSQATEITAKRPALLSLLCILSFISNGLMVIVGLAGIFSSGYISGLMEEYSKGYETLGREMLLTISFSVLLVFGLKLWGVILMFFGRKSGYIMYLVPTGLLMILNIVLLFGAYSSIAMVYFLISLIFIVGYGIFLKHMK